MDPSFTPDEQLAILKAIQSWEIATGGKVCFVAGNGIPIIKTDTPQEILQLEEEARGAKCYATILGWWDRHSIRLVTPKLPNSWIVYSVAAHELGHILGLPHYDGPEMSVMHSGTGPAPLYIGIPKRDVDALKY